MKIILCLVGGSKIELDTKKHSLFISLTKVGIVQPATYLAEDAIEDFVLPVSLLESIDIVKD